VLTFVNQIAFCETSEKIFINDSIPHDSIPKKTVVNGSVSINNIAFAPVPAFSFNSPILISTLTVKRNKFTYNADLSLGLNGKPYMFNNWFRYAICSEKKINLQVSANAFLYFTPAMESKRNLSFEIMASPRKVPFYALYQYVEAFDSATIGGSLINVGYQVPKITIKKSFYLRISPQILYFNFTDNYDGLYTGVNFSIASTKCPISINLLTNVPIWTDFVNAGVKNKFGLMYSF